MVACISLSIFGATEEFNRDIWGIKAVSSKVKTFRDDLILATDLRNNNGLTADSNRFLIINL